MEPIKLPSENSRLDVTLTGREIHILSAALGWMMRNNAINPKSNDMDITQEEITIIGGKLHKRITEDEITSELRDLVRRKRKELHTKRVGATAMDAVNKADKEYRAAEPQVTSVLDQIAKNPDYVVIKPKGD